MQQAARLTWRRSRSSRRCRRPQTGIATYSAAVLDGMRRAGLLERHDVHPMWPLASDAEERVEAADVAVYQLGNNVEFHGEIYRLSVWHPGVAVLHDLALDGLMYGLGVARSPLAEPGAIRGDRGGPAGRGPRLSARRPMVRPGGAPRAGRDRALPVRGVVPRAHRVQDADRDRPASARRGRRRDRPRAGARCGVQGARGRRRRGRRRDRRGPQREQGDRRAARRGRAGHERPSRVAGRAIEPALGSPIGPAAQRRRRSGDRRAQRVRRGLPRVALGVRRPGQPAEPAPGRDERIARAGPARRRSDRS